jgi:UDP-glucose 4-epimerase
VSRCLVTGATSFIGRKVCEELLAGRNETFAFARPGSAGLSNLKKLPGLTILLGEMETIAESLRPVGTLDTVIHLAWEGIGSAGRADKGIQDRNFRDSMKLVKVAGDLGCRVFVGGGSQAEYGKRKGITTEESPCNPVSEYGKAKLRFTLDAPQACDRFGMKWRMPRLFSVFGPGDHPWTLMASLLQALERQQRLPLTDCTQYWNYLYVTDAARALAMLMEECHPNGIYNVASEVSRPLKEFVLTVCSLFPDSPIPDFGAIPRHPDGPGDLMPSTMKLRCQTGWKESYAFSDALTVMIQQRRMTTEQI